MHPGNSSPCAIERERERERERKRETERGR